jgi:hypothetical protein
MIIVPYVCIFIFGPQLHLYFLLSYFSWHYISHL